MEKIMDLYDRHGKKKTYFAISILLLVIHILIIFTVYQKNIAFTIDGVKYKYVSDEGKKILFEDDKKTPLTIIVEAEENLMPSYSAIASKYRVEYGTKLIKVDYSNWIEEGIVITLSDGREYKARFPISIKGMNMDNLPADVRLVRNINHAYDFSQNNAMKVLPLIGYPIILLGLVGIMYPRKLWSFSYMFAVKDGEPTDWAIFNNVLGGIILIGFALLLPVLFAG